MSGEYERTQARRPTAVPTSPTASTTPTTASRCRRTQRRYGQGKIVSMAKNMAAAPRFVTLSDPRGARAAQRDRPLTRAGSRARARGHAPLARRQLADALDRDGV